MFEAYSLKNHDKICIDDVVDLSDIFKCLNPNCKAEFTPKGLDSGVVTRHFARKKSTPHVKGCPYALFSSSFVDSSDMIKNDLLDIYDNQNRRSANQNNHTSSTHSSTESKVIRISTPKQLLNYCISNRLSTEYKDGIHIYDIIVDERNLLFNANFQGFQGLKMVVGYTQRFDNNKLYMYVSTKTKSDKTVKLKAVVTLPAEQLSEIKRIILNTYDNSFSNHPIAVFGMWETDEMYVVKCTVSKKGNVIYKFATE